MSNLGTKLLIAAKNWAASFHKLDLQGTPKPWAGNQSGAKKEVVDQYSRFPDLTVLDWVWIDVCKCLHYKQEIRNEKLVSFADVVASLEELVFPDLARREAIQALKRDALSHEAVGKNTGTRYLFRTKNGETPLKGNKIYKDASWRL